MYYKIYLFIIKLFWFLFSFIQYFRINKDAFLWILDEIGETLISTSIPLAIQLAASLRFFAEGGFQRSVGNDAVIALHRTTFSKSFSKILVILENILCTKWVELHTDPTEIQKSKRHFSNKFGIPGVIGCIDGTHIEIVKPGPHDHLFYNRKGYYSINAMIVSINICK